jgi:two-component system, NarL family, nitrate/nitrite response regulator NarL
VSTGRTPAVRVFIVDDHAMVREGLRMLVERAKDLAVCGEAANGAEALESIASARPDLVLLDLDLATEDGLTLLPRLAPLLGDAKVLVLTGIRDRARHEAALLAGARGLVLKDRPPETLLHAIRKVHAGEIWFDRALLDAALSRAMRGPQAGRSPEAARIAALTAREREIVELVGRGLKTEQIGERLSISEKTVRNHLTAIFDKLGVSDRLELLMYAYREKLVSLPP